MSRWTALAAALVVVAAPATAQEDAKAAASPSAAVEEFMRAAADSNLTRMAQLFGTDKGSSARTGDPSDFPRRMVVMQATLKGIVVKANAETAMGKKNHSLVTTEIAKGGCKVTVPVTAVKAREGWLVREFDLTAVWDGINRPCEATGRPGNTEG
jgi:hypothetical protein